MGYPTEAIRFLAGTSSQLAEPVPSFPVLPGLSLFTLGWFPYEHDSHTAQTRGPMSGSGSGQPVADV